MCYEIAKIAQRLETVYFGQPWVSRRYAFVYPGCGGCVLDEIGGDQERKVLVGQAEQCRQVPVFIPDPDHPPWLTRSARRTVAADIDGYPYAIVQLQDAEPLMAIVANHS